jgi:hypothetical protein
MVSEFHLCGWALIPTVCSSLIIIPPQLHVSQESASNLIGILLQVLSILLQSVIQDQ